MRSTIGPRPSSGLVVFRFALAPVFEPGEQIRFSKPIIWGMTSDTPPSYRIGFSLPPLWEVGMYVTDRRVLFVSYFLRLCLQEINVWYPEFAGADETRECLKSVGVHKGSWWDALELNSEGRPRWWRSKELRLRLYMRAPARLLPLFQGIQGVAVQGG